MQNTPPDSVAPLAVTGLLSEQSGRTLYEQSERAIAAGQNVLAIDLSSTHAIDSLGGAWLARVLELGATRGARVELTGATGKVRRFLDLAGPGLLAPPRCEEPEAGPLEKLGEMAFAVLAECRDGLNLIITTIYWTLVAPLEGRGFRWNSLIDELDRMGAQAVFIVCLTNYLLGLIIAMLSGVQLRSFGAELYVADLVVIAFSRELAPIMTAVIVSARSGAAIAAELATMKVQDEINALRALGLDPGKFLIAPRVVALTIAMPALSLLGLIMGTLGGLHLGTIFMGFTHSQWINQTLLAARGGDVLLGLSKSLVFAVLIVLVGCHNGLRVAGGARGVGLATTRAVVMDIFLIIVTDLLFSLPEFLFP